MPTALGVDVGSTNVKAALIDADGVGIAVTQRALRSDRDGPAVTQDAGAMWDAVVDTVAELTAAHPDAAGEIGTIGVCSQYSSIVPVGADARPVAPMVMWSDHRGTDHSLAILADDDAFLTWLDRHGIPPLGSGLALAHILHLQHDRPELLDATHAWLEPMDYVTARLTGRITATQHSMFMAQLCDNRRLDTTEYDDGLVTMAGVDATKLPPLVPVDEPVGTLHPDVADALGVPADVIVLPGTNDTAIVGVAAGMARPGRAGLAIGTTSVVVDTVDRKDTDIDHEILSMPGIDPDRYLVFAENGYGGRLVEYVLDEIVHASDVIADHGTDDLFARLDAVLQETGAGVDGTLFLPWLGGSLAPSASPGMRGGFVNVSLATRRVDLVRAVTEGVAHNLAWLLPHVETFTGRAIDELAFVGGAARSPGWCQVLADVLGRTVTPTIDPDTAVARAAARLALSRAGHLDADIVADGVELGRPHEPDPAHRELYDLHQEQFEAAFAALRPISETLTTFHGARQ